MAAEPDKSAESAEAKKASAGNSAFIVALLVLAFVGAGAGAAFSMMFLRSGPPAGEAISAAADPAAKKTAADQAVAKAGESGKSVSKSEVEGRKEHVATLEPILVTLAGPQRAWARLELAVVLSTETKEDHATLVKTMTEDLMSFMRTVPLTHVESAAGVEYLREDLSEIVRLRSKGRARGVILRSLVVE